MVDPGDITQLIAAARGGDSEAWNRLVAAVYSDLRRLSRRALSGGQRDQTLDTTGLVHECYLRLAGSGAAAIADRAHFFALAARVMRQVIVDYAREKLAVKRGGGVSHAELDETLIAEARQAEQLIAVDSALTRLSGLQPRQAQVVECRFFAGLSEDETASALSISLRSVQRDWEAARAWLTEQLA